MKNILCLITVLLGIAVASAVNADQVSERERALEQRVEQLERLVQQLLEERQPAPAPVETRVVQALAERVDRLEEEKAPHVTSDPGTRFSYGGFIKTDVMLSRYSAGSAPARGLIRDFYVPGLVPVGGDPSTTDIDYHTRESRFWFKTDTQTAGGKSLTGYLEFDFSAATGGDERLTNATSPSIRHAFLRYENLLIGQYWSNFFNVAALPENLDFVGPAEGTIFIRQPLIQYTSGAWQFAAENPETTVTPYGGGARIVTDTSHIPDLTVRYTTRGDWGHVAFAGLGRQLAIDGPAGTSRKAAFAASISGLLKIGQRNDFRWMVSGGPGIGRYLGLNTTNDAVLDADGDLDPIEAYGGFVSYRHFWSPNWRSNFTLSAFYADNDVELMGVGPTKRSESAHANLIYQLSSHLRFGVEYIYARRGTEAGDKGNMNRLQFSAIYAF